MRRNRLLAPLLAAALLALVLAGNAPAAAPSAPVDPEVLGAPERTSALVHVGPGSTISRGLEAARSAGLETGTRYGAIKVFVAYGTGAEFSDLAQSPAVEYVEANGLLDLLTNTSHKATRGKRLLTGKVKVSGKKITGKGVGVAVVDSGVDGTHPDLAPNMGSNVRIVCSVPGSNAVGPLGFSECRGPKTAVHMDDTDHPGLGGHGTHVAGIVAGKGKASNGKYHGAAPGVRWYGVGTGTTLVVENALDGLRWVLNNHNKVKPRIRVVNNSWGSGYKEADEDDPQMGAITKLQNALIKAGVTVVFAAGNSGGDGTRPRTSQQCVNPKPGLVCVANYDDKDKGTRKGSIAGSSSRGSKSDPLTWPDLAAPGTRITAACRPTLPVCHLGSSVTTGYYGTLSGTSMAAPHVAGIIAQMYQANPKLKPKAIENLLEDNAHKFKWGAKYVKDPRNPDDRSSFDKGHGLVDAVAAVKAAARRR